MKLAPNALLKPTLMFQHKQLKNKMILLNLLHEEKLAIALRLMFQYHQKNNGDIDLDIVEMTPIISTDPVKDLLSKLKEVVSA